jgi:hypothetical protein
MLNDVHIPPVEPQSSPAKAHRPVQGSHHAGLGSHHANPKGNRLRERLPTVEHADVPEAIYGEPEDRGDSFNTVFSASVVAIVVLVVVGLAWAVFL